MPCLGTSNVFDVCVLQILLFAENESRVRLGTWQLSWCSTLPGLAMNWFTIPGRDKRCVIHSIPFLNKCLRLRYGHHFCSHFHNFFYAHVTSYCVFHVDILLLEWLNRVLMNMAHRTVERNRNERATFVYNQISRLCRSLQELGCGGR